MKFLFLFLSLMIFFSCTPKDSDIKKSIAVSAKDQLMFAGINYSVNQGVVVLTGNCASEEMKQKVEQYIQSLGGVKRVVDNVSIAPVLLDSNFVLKQKVDSVLASYSTAESQVQNGVARLTGQIKQKDEDKLIKALDKLHLAGIENELTVMNK